MLVKPAHSPCMIPYPIVNAIMRPSYLTFVLLAFLFVAGTGCAPAQDTAQADSQSAPSLPAGIASDQGESWFTTANGEYLIVWGRHEDGWSGHTMWSMQRTEEGWTEPAVLPFSGTYNDRGGRFYPGLDALLFSSDRPLPGEEEAGDFNIWIAMFDGISWVDPEPLASLNSDANDFHASIAGDASIFFASDREGGQGGADLYRAELGVIGYETSVVPGPLNSAQSEADVWIDPAMRYIIFSRTDDPAGFGGDDLWISFPDGDSWGEPINLGSSVNSTEYEYGPWVSRDGATLYFTTHVDGDADIREVALADLGIEGPEGWLASGVE